MLFRLFILIIQVKQLIRTQKLKKLKKKHITMIISQENGKIFTAKLKHTQLANKDIPNFAKAHILMKK